MTDTAAASRAPVGAPSGVDVGVDPVLVAELAAPLAAEAGCGIYDVQWRGGTLVVLATAAAGGAVGVDALSRLSRRLSAALDAADLVGGRYVLEVSSPGLERRLRRPDHFADAVGERVVIRTSTPPRQRIVGEIVDADDEGVRIRADVPGQTVPGQTVPDQTLTVPYGDIAKARTTFEWGSPPRSPSGKQAP